MRGKSLNSLSIVIPLFNEEGNVIPLHEEISQALKKVDNLQVEFIYVNDGSTDTTKKQLEKLNSVDKRVKAVNLKKNLGQGMALYKGISSSQYELICTLDGDRQFYPDDIVKFYHAFINEEVDFICGQRMDREDDAVTKKIPSRLGNILISWTFKSSVKDVGCALKVFKRNDIVYMNPFKNYHRYLSLFLVWNGAKYKQIQVNHRARVSGVSKYTVFKFLRVLYELLWIKFYYLKTIKRPISKFSQEIHD